MSNQDKKTISNQPHEIAAAAKSMGVEPICIYLAKHETKSNNREVIKEWIEKWRGSSVGVII
jgi:DNA invertase Pin-like site-specific DNA recombinase